MRVSAMTYPYPDGTLSATEAVSRAVLFSAGKSHREAWRDICQLILRGSLRAYILSGGRSYDADRAQFAALGDLDHASLIFRQFESTTLESSDDFGFSRKALIPGIPRMSPPIFDGRNRHVSGLLFFFESDFYAAWASMEPRRHGGGRPPTVKWDTIKQECFRLMESRGDFSAGDQEWNCQARLAEKLLDFSSVELNVELSDSVVRDKIPNWLREWRATRSAPKCL
jgi:hypothetical protein